MSKLLMVFLSVIMTDDVGYWNIGAEGKGMMGVLTPATNRIASEGILFTDRYAAPSCTAGRAVFVTGQQPIRTGLTTVGMPVAPIGLDRRDGSLKIQDPRE